MQRVLRSTFLLLAGFLSLPTVNGGDLPAVGPVPDTERERLSLMPVYSQYCRSSGGIPVVASGRVQPEALAEAAWLIDRMLDSRPDKDSPVNGTTATVFRLMSDS